MKNESLLTLLQGVLGTHEKSSGNNVLFYCPFCHHYKRKLVIKLDTNLKKENEWHCWVCNVRGRKLTSLFKLLHVDVATMQRLVDVIGLSSVDINNLFGNSESYDETKLRLPNEYTSFLIKTTSLWHNAAIKYLRNERNLSNYDIVKYHLGYCETGQFKNKIIIPSYNKNGELNYFVSRDFVGSESKFKNPDTSKNVVPFELYINWNLPIVLVEGAFDAMTVKRNAIPLFGKVIPEELKLKIIQMNVQHIYVCLDNDAFKVAVKTCEEFMRMGKTVYFVNLQDKDPNVIGFENMTKLIKSTKPLTFSDLIKFKFKL